jgi:hypothetical protein
MAFLERIPRASIPLAAAAIALASCVWLHNQGGTKRFAFSHRRHVVEEKLECVNCHADALASDVPGMPAPDTCVVCHDGIDAEKPPERHVDTLFHDEEFAAVRASALSGEVVFPHGRHASKEACADCHRGIETNEAAADLHPLRMDDCTACHASKKVASDCSTCHKEITADWKPPSHESNWKKMHGPTVRAHLEATVERCVLCHTESTCSECHQIEAPANHNPFWRQRGHGIASMVDRENCAACHEPTSCERCHAEAKPRNHTPSWGSPTNGHCVSCHQPLSAEACNACHAGTPSHYVPKPDDHFPGMDCRSCHGAGVRLPHVDNGEDCNSCHIW